MAKRETMQIVIDIPKEDYEGICHLENEQLRMLPIEVAETLIRIANGTPLQKGHGRLIDADYTIKQLLSLPKNELSTEDMWAMKVLDLASTIIEADIESEEVKE